MYLCKRIDKKYMQLFMLKTRFELEIEGSYWKKYVPFINIVGNDLEIIKMIN
jgi:hypothetical protein